MDQGRSVELFRITRCASGCVRLHFGITVIHLRPDEFDYFLRHALAWRRSAADEMPTRPGPSESFH